MKNKIDLSSTDLMALPVPDGPHGYDTYEDTKLEGYSLTVDSAGKRQFKMHAVVPKDKRPEPEDRKRPINDHMMYVVGEAGIDSEVVARKCAEILQRMAQEGFLPFHGSDFAELDHLRVPDLQNVIRAAQRERAELLQFIAVIERDRQEMREWLEK